MYLMKLSKFIDASWAYQTSSAAPRQCCTGSLWKKRNSISQIKNSKMGPSNVLFLRSGQAFQEENKNVIITQLSLKSSEFAYQNHLLAHAVHQNGGLDGAELSSDLDSLGRCTFSGLSHWAWELIIFIFTGRRLLAGVERVLDDATPVFIRVGFQESLFDLVQVKRRLVQLNVQWVKIEKKKTQIIRKLTRLR